MRVDQWWVSCLLLTLSPQRDLQTFSDEGLRGPLGLKGAPLILFEEQQHHREEVQLRPGP